MSRSSSVVLDNVDDYLTPSNACINPLFQLPPEEKEAPKKKSGVVVPKRRVRRNINDNDNSLRPPSPKTPIPVKASIVDCLACSGCVTTAETVLLEQRHSLNSLRLRLEDTQGQPRAITLSPNSLADLCRHWKLSPMQLYRPLTTMLHEVLCAILVIDGNLPLQWTWVDEAQEFVDCYQSHSDNDRTKPAIPAPSIAVDSERTTYYKGGNSETVENSKDWTPANIPLISGSCPALVCLVEKSLSHLVPYLSQSQSPMSRMGNLLKAEGTSWEHWAIMPCHDKKLEACRPNFLDKNKIYAVDLVITTQELIELLEEWATQNLQEKPESLSVAKYLQSLAPADELVLSEPNQFPRTIIPSKPTWITTLTTPNESNDKLQKQMAFSSGGHANLIFSYAAKQLFGCKLERVQWQPASLVTTAVKSARLAKQQKQHSYQAQLYRQEDGSYSQNANSGELVLNFGIAHGMQTMQRALKHLADHDGVQSFHYLEAMACPYGCLNGGAAITSRKRETPSETRQRVGATLESLQIPKIPAVSCPPQRTRYHVVPPMQHTMGAAAGVQVEDMLW